MNKLQIPVREWTKTTVTPKVPTGVFNASEMMAAILRENLGHDPELLRIRLESLEKNPG